MIYDLITTLINNYLGDGDYIIKYANNHDVDWKSILPTAQNEIKYGVLRVDSGTTQQLGGRTIRTEQLRLIVAIPEEREIFNAAVTNLRSMLDGLNNTTINDPSDNITANLFFGEYHDAACQTVNGNRWWVAEVTFAANFFDGVYDFNNTKVEIKIPVEVTEDDVTSTIMAFVEMAGIISKSYTIQKQYDQNVYNGNPLSRPSANSIAKSLQIDLVYLKNNDLINYLLEVEEEINQTLEIKYTNGIKTRTFNCEIASITETTITGDILKATIVFTNK